MDDWRDFHGPNAGHILELYDRFRQNPESVDAATRAYFASAELTKRWFYRERKTSFVGHACA